MEPVRSIHVDLLASQQTNKLHRLLHSMQCNVALGTVVLVIGVVITVVSLKDYENDNKVFLVGPVLMTVGLLGMTRAVVNHFKGQEQRFGRERRRRRRGNSNTSSESQPSHTNHRQRQESESAICLGPSISEYEDFGLMNHVSVSSSFDEPPPYESVANMGSRANLAISLPSLPPYDEGITNPGLDLSYEPMAPPPPYDEIMGNGRSGPPVGSTSELHEDTPTQRPSNMAPVMCVAVPIQLPASHNQGRSQQQHQQQQYLLDNNTHSASGAEQEEPSLTTSNHSSPSHKTTIPTSPSGKLNTDSEQEDEDISASYNASSQDAASVSASPDSPTQKPLSNRASSTDRHQDSFTCISETTNKVHYDSES